MPTIQSITALNASLAQLQRTYKTADANADGALSLAEFEAAARVNKGLNGDRGQSAAMVFKKLDANGNGTVSSAELSQGINLNSQVQAVLLQGQEIASGSAFAALLGAATQGASYFRDANDYTGLTSSLFGGGSASSSLTSILSGGNGNTSASAGLFGGLSASTTALIQQLLSRYEVPNPTTPPSTSQSA